MKEVIQTKQAETLALYKSRLIEEVEKRRPKDKKDNEPIYTLNELRYIINKIEV